MIDLLRATTTICQALASGAREVVPFLEDRRNARGAARRRAQRRSCSAANGAAERSRVLISATRRRSTRPRPSAAGACSSPPPTARGALTMRGWRRRVVVGAIVNLSAVVASVKDEPRVDILCAGTGGEETREDILAAGAIGAPARSMRPKSVKWNACGRARPREWRKRGRHAATAQGRSIAEQVGDRSCGTRQAAATARNRFGQRPRRLRPDRSAQRRAGTRRTPGESRAVGENHCARRSPTNGGKMIASYN